MITETLQEDLVSNGLLALVLVCVLCMRDFCKRVSHSDCSYDRGLKIRLPTWRAQDDQPSNVI